MHYAMLVVSYSKHLSSLLPPILFLPLHLLLETRQIQGRIKPRPLAKTQQREGNVSYGIRESLASLENNKRNEMIKKTYIAIPTVLYVVLNTDSASSVELLFYPSVSECGVLFTVWRQYKTS